tara:strand:- start:1458 stop:1868 length:411 start_codon:yes stop_codon:yes gene_type:complete
VTQLDSLVKIANIAIMPINYDIHALHPSGELPSSPASQLKNAFKGVYQQALEVGAVSITRNRKREAILLSATLYDQIIAELAARDPLEVLRKDYDARFAAMQTNAAKEALQGAFDASPAELSRTAVAQTKSHESAQ